MSAFVISDWRPIRASVVQGAFSVGLPSGMILKGCTLCEKEGRRWVSGPARQYEANGVKKYDPLIEFVDKATRDWFSVEALAALDVFLGTPRS